MCELFALSANLPVAATFSLETFSRHGGLEGPHKDGWGIAFYDGNDARLIREPDAAADSPWLRFVEAHPFASPLILSHIRKATRGDRTLANTQPFTRELGGRRHVFAHNGHVAGIVEDSGFAISRFNPVGATDSEHAFCALLERLAPLWTRPGSVPGLRDRAAAVADFAAALRPFGPANFLYADGDTLFVHGHRRRQPNGEILPPGLTVATRNCAPEAPFAAIEGLDLDTERQTVVAVASVPLSDEIWTPLVEGEVLAIRDGAIAARVTPEGAVQTAAT